MLSGGTLLDALLLLGTQLQNFARRFLAESQQTFVQFAQNVVLLELIDRIVGVVFGVHQ